MKKFLTYEKAVEFYKICQGFKLPRHLKDQLLRATSSIVLNLAEGAAKPTAKDQAKFYYISLGSLRESQAVFALAPVDSPAIKLSDELGAMLYKLIKSRL